MATSSATAPRYAHRDVRVYRIDGVEYPSVTTILSVIAKPALGPWYAKEERKAFEAALLELASSSPVISSDALLDETIRLVDTVRAGERAKRQAATIGSAAHALIEWHTRRMMGEKVGPEPVVPDKAAWAVMAWQDWARDVGFDPVAVERVVHCPDCHYAGTVDWVAMVKGVMTLGDYKTGKAVYAESYLQNIAYRHAAARSGLVSSAGIVVRLPKEESDPTFEAVPVPDDTTFVDFRAASHLWRWWQRSQGRTYPMPRKCNSIT